MQKTILYKGVTIQVSDSGEIKINGRVKTPYLNKDGYPVISIKTSSGWRAVGVHRLVAMAFIENPNNLPQVNHKNYNRTDFSIENLQWISHADNVRYSINNYPDRNRQNNPNYGNHKLHTFYAQHPQIAKEKQGRKGKRNGRYKHGRYMQESATTIPDGSSELV